MNNTVTTYLEFDYQGRHLSLQTVLNLDQLMARYGQLPDLYAFIASQHHIDRDSYEYEVMLTYDISYTQAQGWAKKFVKHNQFDQKGFEETWHEMHLFEQLIPLLKHYLDIDNIEQAPELKPVILAAYQFGKASQHEENGQ